MTRAVILLKVPQWGSGVAGTMGTGIVWWMVHQNHQVGTQ